MFILQAIILQQEIAKLYNIKIKLSLSDITFILDNLLQTIVVEWTCGMISLYVHLITLTHLVCE